MDEPESSVSVKDPPKLLSRIRQEYLERYHVSKVIIFVTTFVSYALYHASRKTLSVVKSTLKSQWMGENSTEIIYPRDIWEENPLFDNPDAADNFLGYLDAIFMAIYAAGMYGSGWLGDRVDPRILVAIGMWGTGVTLVMFGSFTEWVHFYNIPFYVIIYILFGFFQSFGWPNEVAIMANWFGKNNRGFVLGLWSSCQPVGNIIGAAIVSACLPYGTEIAFLVLSSLMFFGGFVFFFGIVTSPTEMGLHVPDAEDDLVEVKERPLPISFLRAILLPGVLAYCLCNACLKLVNYAFFFWLPFYLDNAFGWSQEKADDLSIWYDMGGIVGSVIGGIISDRIGCRSPVIVVMLFGSLFALFVYSETPANEVLNASVMTVVGALISGPYNLIVSTIAADLGSQPQLAGNSEAMSTVTGLVDGTGSFGSAIGQVIVPAIDHNLSWNYVFYLFIVMNFLSILCLMRRFIQDCRPCFHRCVGDRNLTCCQGQNEEQEPLLEDSTDNLI